MVRVKHRYLLVNILYPESKTAYQQATHNSSNDVPYTIQFHQPSSDRVDGRLLMRLIRDGVEELFGDYGSGMIAGSLQIKYFSPATSTAIIRVSRDHYRLVWAALAFATKLPRPVEQPCVMQVVRVSGTIKKAEEEAIRRARLSIRRAQRASKASQVDLGTTTNEAVIQDESDDLEDTERFANGIEDAEEAGDVDVDSY